MPSSLSQKDHDILNKIFNPTLYIPNLNEDEQQILNISDDPAAKNVDPEIKRLELEAIKLAESDPKSISDALNLIDEAISQCPSNDVEYYPSLYNNKAQMLRLLGRDQEALHLLNEILNLNHLSNSVRRQSAAQRGWLHFRAGEQEAAFKDFETAGKLGCSGSRRMAVRCNPYAAMCNQMLQEIVQSTFYTGSK